MIALVLGLHDAHAQWVLAWTEDFDAYDDATFTGNDGWLAGWSGEPWDTLGTTGVRSTVNGFDCDWGVGDCNSNYLVKTSETHADLRIDARLSSGDDDTIGIVFRWTSDLDYYVVFWSDDYVPRVNDGSGESDAGARLYSVVGGTAREVARTGTSGYTQGQWHDVRIDAVGATISVWLDENRDGTYGITDLAFLVNDGDHASGSVGFYAYSSNDAEFDDLSVYDFALDADGDGVPASSDCDDLDAGRYPGNTEVVDDGIDQDCDDADDCLTDADDDGARTTAVDPGGVDGDLDCDDPGEGQPADPIDCADGNAAIHPGAAELPGDNVDQDCNLAEDCFADADDDGSRTAAVDVGGVNDDTDCNDANEGRASDPVDCDDTQASVEPGAPEVPADGIDQDCDRADDCYVDADDDGARTTTADPDGTVADMDCADPGEGGQADPIDCADGDPARHPGAVEAPGDDVDQDCDGVEDCYVDADDDGARTLTVDDGGTIVDADCDDPGEGLDADPIDCLDTDPSVGPGAVEGVADEIDQDCDGSELCYEDVDLDGHGTAIVVASVDPDCDDPGESADAIDPCPLDPADDGDGDGVCDSDDVCPTGDDRDDADGDGVPAACDPCPLDARDDSDQDGVCDGEDRCPGLPDAGDADADGVPDACDVCNGVPDALDGDGDGVCDAVDRCPGVDDALDADGDGQPDPCDPCPLDAPDDSDFDGACDADDLCPAHDDGLDTDTDGTPNGCDACTTGDADGDGNADDCDRCPGFDDTVDTDGDGRADGCDTCPVDGVDDSDGDGVCESVDRCPGFDDALDLDGDGTPNLCDPCLADPLDDRDGDGMCDSADPCPDDVADDEDGDGVCDGADTCPGEDDGLDEDGDGVPSGCDPCPLDAADDSDLDGTCDTDDRCPGWPDDLDADADGTPNACETTCTLPDSDGDTVPDDCDRCPGGDDREDGDGDGIPAACDPDDPGEPIGTADTGPPPNPADTADTADPGPAPDRSSAPVGGGVAGTGCGCRGAPPGATVLGGVLLLWAAPCGARRRRSR